MRQTFSSYFLKNFGSGIVCLFFFIFFGFEYSKAQQKDSLVIQTDSLSKELVIVKKHSPKKAAILSTIVPGLGQAYNKKYWKIPIVYAGMGTFYYLFQRNQNLYTSYKRAYILRTDKSPDTIDEFEGLYSPENLIQFQDLYRRNRDLCFIGMTVFYVLNIVDANVDAHLFSFDVSEDLSFNLQPCFNFSSTKPLTAGFSLTLKL